MRTGLILVGICMGGCNVVPVYEQTLASSRPMVFDDTGAELARNSLTTQIEPGAASGDSNSGGGCTSCK